MQMVSMGRDLVWGRSATEGVSFFSSILSVLFLDFARPFGYRLLFRGRICRFHQVEYHPEGIVQDEVFLDIDGGFERNGKNAPVFALFMDNLVDQRRIGNFQNVLREFGSFRQKQLEPAGGRHDGIRERTVALEYDPGMIVFVGCPECDRNGRKYPSDQNGNRYDSDNIFHAPTDVPLEAAGIEPASNFESPEDSTGIVCFDYKRQFENKQNRLPMALSGCFATTNGRRFPRRYPAK